MNALGASDWVGIAGIVVAILGLLGIWYQVGRSSRDSTAGALLSSIAGRWQTIEEMKYRLRVEGCDVDVTHDGIEEYLRGKRHEDFDGDPEAFQKAFDLVRMRLDDGDGDVDRVIVEAMKEYRIYDLIFSLCEDEYMAHELEFTRRDDLWGYWKWYIDRTFEGEDARHYWEIRQEFGTTYEGFADFVELTYFGR